MIRIDKIIQYAILILLILHSGLFYYSSSYNPSLGASTQTALSMRPGYGDIDMNGNNILDIGTFSANSLSATGTLTIPTSSDLLTDSAGEIGIDLTSDQLRYYVWSLGALIHIALAVAVILVIIWLIRAVFRRG